MVPMSTIQLFGPDAECLRRGGVAAGKAPAEIAEELRRLGWQSATLLRAHHKVVGWRRPYPDGEEQTTWCSEDS